MTGIAAKYPTDLDAIMLTGYAPSMASVPLAFTAWSQTLAKEQSDSSIRSRWLSLPSGGQYLSDSSYMGTGSPSSDRFAFFAEGSYDEGVFYSLNLAAHSLTFTFSGAFTQAYNTKQTHTMGEFLTIAEPVSQPATNYKGDVFDVTGEKDM